MGATLRVAERSKLGGDEGPGPVLSGDYFHGDKDGKI